MALLLLAGSAAVPRGTQSVLQPKGKADAGADWAPFSAKSWHQWRSHFSIGHMERLVQCVGETTPAAKPPKPTEKALTICKNPQNRPCQTPQRKAMTAKELEWYVLEKHELSDMDADSSACYFVLSIPSRMDMARNTVKQLRQRGAKGRVMVMRGLEPQNPLNGSKAPWDDESGKNGDMVSLIWNFHRDRGLPLASGNLCPRKINIFMEDDVELCSQADEIVAQARRAPLTWLGYTSGGRFGAQMWSVWKDAIPAAHEAFRTLKAGFVDHAFLKTMMAPLADRSLASTSAHHDVEPKKYWECDDEAKAAPRAFPDWWAEYRTYAGGKLPSTCVINVTRSAEALMELDMKRAEKRAEKYEAEKRETEKRETAETAVHESANVLATQGHAAKRGTKDAPPTIDTTTQTTTPQTTSDGFARILAMGGEIQRSFTCMVDDIEKTCPGSMELAKVNQYQDFLKPKPNEKWLFYGPSYLTQIFQVVLAANREDVVERLSIGEDGAIDVEATQKKLQEGCGVSHPMNKTSSSLIAHQPDDEPCGADGHSAECNLVTNSDCKCTSPNLEYPVYKLKNGAEIHGMLNARAFQDQNQGTVITMLQTWLNSGVKYDQVFYMEPHGSNYFAEHCRATQEHRGVDETKIMGEGDIDMCFQHKKEEVDLGGGQVGVQQSSTTATEYVQCVKNMPAYKMMYEHVSSIGASIMVIAPWVVMPSPELAQNSLVYTSFEAGHKYSCVSGGSTPEQMDYGVGTGICPLTDEPPNRRYKTQMATEPKERYQGQHPCVLICGPDGPDSCVPGPATRMAVDIVTRARKTPIPGDDEDYTGYSDMSAVFAAQACGNMPIPTTRAASTTTPETTTPETTAPETTAPETTAPETTVPETTAPETTAPQPTTPLPTIDTTTQTTTGGDVADFAHMLATGGDVQRQFTCVVDNIEDSCPGTMELAKLSTLQSHKYLKPKPNEKWLFYGPSYLTQIYQVVLAANREDIVETTQIGDDGAVDVKRAHEVLSEMCGGNDVHMSRKSNSLFAKSSNEDGLKCEDECNILSSSSCTCNVNSEFPMIKLKNGAEIYAMTNSRVFQDQAQEVVVKLLQDWLGQPNFKLDQVFYMEPHGRNYFAEHCAAAKEGRAVVDDNVRDENGIDMCFKHDTLDVLLTDGTEGVQASSSTVMEYVQCVKKMPAYKMMYQHVSSMGASIMIIAPWAVLPSPELAKETHVYSTFEAGHKYSCVSGGSLPEQKDYGVGTGVCSPTGGGATAPYKSMFTVIPKYRYQSQHPCAVVCEPNGPNQCVPGPAARMAVDIVTRARQTPIPGDVEDYTGYSDMLQVYAEQTACANDVNNDKDNPGTPAAEGEGKVAA